MYKVSIIVPVYNAEKTLERCLDSILQQTFVDFEVLLVNDGSKDSSAEICERYCNLDARFKLFSQKNAGPSAARNNGLDKASGDYVYFVDSDDYLENNAVEELYRAAVDTGADVTICGFYRIINSIKNQHEFPYSPGIYEGEDCRKIAVDLIDNMSNVYLPPYSWIRMIRSDILRKFQLSYATNIIRSEDYLFTTDLHFKIDKLCLITNLPLYYYIDTEGSITNKYVANYWTMSKQIFHDLNRKLPNEKNIQNKLNSMLIQRSMIALNNSCKNPDAGMFKMEIINISNDRLLLQAVNDFSYNQGYKFFGFYFILMKSKLKGIVVIWYKIKRFLMDKSKK